MAEEKPFPRIRKFVVLFNTEFVQRAQFLSGGLMAVSSQDSEDVPQWFSTGNSVIMKLVHESGRYEHEEKISKKFSIKISLTSDDLDQLVKRGLWREKEVAKEDLK